MAKRLPTRWTRSGRISAWTSRLRGGWLGRYQQGHDVDAAGGGGAARPRHRVRRPHQLQRPPALRPHPLAALQAGLGGAIYLQRVRHPISR